MQELLNKYILSVELNFRVVAFCAVLIVAAWILTAIFRLLINLVLRFMNGIWQKIMLFVLQIRLDGMDSKIGRSADTDKRNRLIDKSNDYANRYNKITDIQLNYEPRRLKILTVIKWLVTLALLAAAVFAVIEDPMGIHDTILRIYHQIENLLL